jgi:hypothetical protein
MTSSRMQILERHVQRFANAKAVTEELRSLLTKFHEHGAGDVEKARARALYTALRYATGATTSVARFRAQLRDADEMSEPATDRSILQRLSASAADRAADARRNGAGAPAHRALRKDLRGATGLVVHPEAAYARRAGNSATGGRRVAAD